MNMSMNGSKSMMKESQTKRTNAGIPQNNNISSPLGALPNTTINNNNIVNYFLFTL